MKRQIELNQIRYCNFGYRNKSTVLLVLAITLLITLQCISCSTIHEEPQSDVDDEVKRLFSSEANGEYTSTVNFFYAYLATYVTIMMSHNIIKSESFHFLPIEFLFSFSFSLFCLL